jgi:MscS family membrane protein
VVLSLSLRQIAIRNIPHVVSWCDPMSGVLAQVSTVSLSSEALRVLGVSAGVFVVLYVFVFVLLRAWIRQSMRSDAGIVAVRVSQRPALLVGIFVITKLTLNQVTLPESLTWIQGVLTAAIAIVSTYWVAQLLTEVLLYYLERYAERSEAQWDDVLVPILKSTLPILTYLIGGIVTLQSLNVDLNGLLVAIGGMTFVLGFALKDILANFFSGLVLLIDTPFRFGDVITLEDGTRAVIKKVGLRVTNLYLIDRHCEIYIPNGAFQNQEIVNLSRPTTDYYYTITLPVKFDADPSLVIPILEAVVLAHPDTLGNIDQKLELLDRFYGASDSSEQVQMKREAGRARLLAEKSVNTRLAQIEDSFEALSVAISHAEDMGFDPAEVRAVQSDYLDICSMIGLEPVYDRAERGRSRQTTLKNAELDEKSDTESLIFLIRDWYRAWLKDPDLLTEDSKVLPKMWEQKLDLMKLKINKLFRKVTTMDADETRLDDTVSSVFSWMQENFKTTRNGWQDPRIWISANKTDASTGGLNKNFTVKFYVDDITLEHFQRGYRVEGELNRELQWQLRQAYLAR